MAARTEKPFSENFSYKDAMDTLCDIIIRSNSIGTRHATPDFGSIQATVARIEHIRLKNIGHPMHSNIRQRCETCALDLHISFIIAWLCRPSLRGRHNLQSKTDVQVQLMEKCIENLLRSVRAFVQLHSLSIVASRSWAVIHNGLSSALLLGLLGETATNGEVRDLLGEILDILSRDPEEQGRQGQDLDLDFELSAPHTRAVTALRRLCNNDSNNFTHNNISNSGGINPKITDDQPQLAMNVERPDDSRGAASNYMDVTGFPGQDDIIQIGNSPLDMFNSIVWNPIDFGDSLLPDYSGSSLEPWMF
ncbi:hypothetical protein BP5796_04208 [Coleophoma crateriformis]|uniref:Transcription factor domain-containing protein n=1 Tax=Coleophoma crateriformis TaxID=565419 RepID=A0A3D8SHV9_9HELO|nr:hypothetical protein BP5796_04208 [Coleophoma crateriformis]